jgi:hypothetical protein
VDEHEKIDRAAQQVDAILGFYIHLTVFVLVMIVLFVTNWLATPSEWWAQWPLFGWGIGVIAHGAFVFRTSPGFISRWRERKIHELKSRM